MTNKIRCFHHPRRVATHIVSLGSSIDLATPVCLACMIKTQQAGEEYTSEPIIKPLLARFMAGEAVQGD